MLPLPRRNTDWRFVMIITFMVAFTNRNLADWLTWALVVLIVFTLYPVARSERLHASQSEAVWSIALAAVLVMPAVHAVSRESPSWYWLVLASASFAVALILAALGSWRLWTFDDAALVNTAGRQGDREM